MNNKEGRVENNYFLFGWQQDRYTKLPFPYREYQSLKATKFIDENGEKKLAKRIAAVMKAAFILAEFTLEETTGEKTPVKNFIDRTAIGTRSGEKGAEITYVERFSKERKAIDIIEYNSKTGKIRGSFMPVEGNRPASYLVGPAPIGAEGTSVYLAMLPSMALHDSFIDEKMNEIYEAQKTEDYMKAYDSALILCYGVYRLLKEDETFPFDPPSQEFEKIGKSEIESGSAGPSKGKVMYGKFHILSVGATAEGTDEALENDRDSLFQKAENLPFVRNEKDFSDTEKAMIPRIESFHVVTNEERFILSEIVDTFSDKLNSINTIMLMGSSSSGKSHMASTLFARMKRPMTNPLVCSPNMDEAALKGVTLPVIEDSDKRRGTLSKADNALLDRLYQAGTDEEARSLIASSLKIPDPEEILYDPCGSYLEMTGKAEEVSADKVIRFAESLITGKLLDLSAKTSTGRGETGISYKYYKSPLVRAIEHGWAIEVQEFNVVKDTALFTCLNNVFDKDGDGILETPYGKVKRHPDFRAVYTANPGYAGSRDPHQSVIARADMVMVLNNPPREVMKKRVKSRMPFDDDRLLDQVIDCFCNVAETAKDIGLTGEATMRELYRFSNAVFREVDEQLAVMNYLINPITRDEEDASELLSAAKATSLFN